ncbi:MAG: hypothetical protein J5992_08030 [Oscillospiraceae bacterium]|nr:hypothetical protein [Oscillospiraceae bacterium]
MDKITTVHFYGVIKQENEENAKFEHNILSCTISERQVKLIPDGERVFFPYMDRNTIRKDLFNMIHPLVSLFSISGVKGYYILTENPDENEVKQQMFQKIKNDKENLVKKYTESIHLYDDFLSKI